MKIAYVDIILRSLDDVNKDGLCELEMEEFSLLHSKGHNNTKIELLKADFEISRQGP